MQTPIRSGQRLQINTALLAALVATALLAGCDKMPMPTTVGQKVDAAIDKTRDVAADVKVEANSAINDAQARYKQDGPKVQSKAQDVATATGKVIDDVAITAQISTGLARDPDLSALKIDVDTKDGAVILRGPAPTSAARQRAGELARGVSGVKSVDNQLAVKAG